MGKRTRILIGLCLLAQASLAPAQPPDSARSGGPAKSPQTPGELDKLALDVLRDLHNRGAELYNRGDAGACFRLYEGALLTVRPFLVHHPAVQKAIDDGLAEVAKSDAVKLQAFRLHEVIEDVRTRLKIELKLTDMPKPAPMPKEKPAQVASDAHTGTVTLDGKPAGAVEVMIVTLDLPEPRIFSAIAKDDGTFRFPTSLPLGKYAVLVTPSSTAKVPEKYRTTGTSGLRIEIAKPPAPLQLNLSTK